MVLDVQKLIKENKKLKDKKSDKFGKAIIKKLSERITSRDILKKEKPITIKISNEKAESIFDDKNRFFNDSYKEERKRLYFE